MDIFCGHNFPRHRQKERTASSQPGNVCCFAKFLFGSDEEFALVLVNQEQPWEGSVPVLVEVEGVSVDERIADALRQMLAAAQAEGCSLSLVKGYVSKEEQDAEYEEVVAQYMQQGYSRIKSEAEASLVVQKGGYSEYQTGLAVDFTAETLAEGQDFFLYQGIPLAGAQLCYLWVCPAVSGGEGISDGDDL